MPSATPLLECMMSSRLSPWPNLTPTLLFLDSDTKHVSIMSPTPAGPESVALMRAINQFVMKERERERDVMNVSMIRDQKASLVSTLIYDELVWYEHNIGMVKLQLFDVLWVIQVTSWLPFSRISIVSLSIPARQAPPSRCSRAVSPPRCPPQWPARS